MGWERTMITAVYVVLSILILVFLAIKVNSWFMRNSRPWRKVHFEAMRNYHGALGTETANSENEKRNFDIANVYELMLAGMGYKDSKMIFANFISREIPEDIVFSAKQYIESVGKGVNLNDSEKDLTLEYLFYKIQESNDKYLQVRLLISEIVEDKYGKSHRCEYLFNVLTGVAI